MIENKFNQDQVKFTVVKISDPADKGIVEKHNATSQTVVIVSTERRKERVNNISDIVKAYTRNRDNTALENQLFAQIKETSK